MLFDDWNQNKKKNILFMLCCDNVNISHGNCTVNLYHCCSSISSEVFATVEQFTSAISFQISWTIEKYFLYHSRVTVLISRNPGEPKFLFLYSYLHPIISYKIAFSILR